MGEKGGCSALSNSDIKPFLFTHCSRKVLKIYDSGYRKVGQEADSGGFEGQKLVRGD